MYYCPWNLLAVSVLPLTALHFRTPLYLQGGGGKTVSSKGTAKARQDIPSLVNRIAALNRLAIHLYDFRFLIIASFLHEVGLIICKTQTKQPASIIPQLSLFYESFS